jgi:hypothetical protein
MNCFSRCLGAFLALFLGFALYVLAQTGVAGFLQAATANLATVQISLDLVVALSLVSVWLWRDAKARGVSPYPYLALTVVLGSVGPLLYLTLKSSGCGLKVCEASK